MKMVEYFRYAHDGCKSREGNRAHWEFLYIVWYKGFGAHLLKKRHLYLGFGSHCLAPLNPFVFFFNSKKKIEKKLKISVKLILFYAVVCCV